MKGPGSGEAAAKRWKNRDHLRPTDELELLLADKADYRWVREVIRERNPAARCPERLTLQQHKLIWGADASGV